MELGLHFIGYLLAFFLAYLYFPKLVFKFGAEYSVDLGRRRDDGQLEEFFAAVIPSTILNGFAWLLLLFAKLVRCPWQSLPDFKVIAAVVTDRKATIASAVADPGHRGALFGYVITLLLVAFFNGLVYGRAVRRRTEQPDIWQRRPKRRGGRILDTVGWLMRLTVWLSIESVCGLYFQVWHPLFQMEVISFYPWSVQQPWVFVRLRENRLYYGRFLRYDKAANGDIESITISNVLRYCYDEVDRCLAEGRIPLSPFQGSLRINIAEITDVHNVPENHFRKIESRYAEMLVQRLARDLLKAFVDQRVSVDDIWIRHAGGTNLKRHHYRQALRYLEGEGFVAIEPSTINGGLNAPSEVALVSFPVRVQSAHDAHVPGFGLPVANLGDIARADV